MTDLSIVIVSFNARADLERCLESLAAHPPHAAVEVIVVDNASGDGSAERARQFRAVRVIEAGANLGFARATNLGLRASTGSAVLLLNSDTIVPPGALDTLLAELDREPQAAVVGPRLVNAAGRAELSFGRMVGPFNELRQKWLALGHARHWPWVARHVERLTSRPAEPDWVSGACLLARRADAEAIGWLDERYFMYLEDVDFCAAIRNRGGLVRFTPAAEIVHLRGRSAAAAPVATAAGYRRSRLAFYQKHCPRWAPILQAYLRLAGHG